MSTSLPVVREGLLRKNCRSFGFCPNYLSFFPPSWLILTFNGTKINLINDGCRCLTTESDFPNFFLVDNTIEFVQSVDYKKNILCDWRIHLLQGKQAFRKRNSEGKVCPGGFPVKMQVLPDYSLKSMSWPSEQKKLVSAVPAVVVRWPPQGLLDPLNTECPTSTPSFGSPEGKKKKRQ